MKRKKTVAKVKAKNHSTKTKAVKAKRAKNKTTKTYPRATGNPFRQKSAYGTVYDVLSAHPDGITRQQLIAKVAKATGKDLRHAGFDCAVLLSAKNGVNGERHRSCRSGFWVQRVNDHCRLRTE